MPDSIVIPRRLLALMLLAGASALMLYDAAPDVRWFDPQWLRDSLRRLSALQGDSPWLFAIAYFALFTLLSALAIPGCCMLALAAGLYFGWVAGTLVVVVASTVGACLSFLVARHLLRDTVRARWGGRLAPIEAGLVRDGPLYLFSLRVVPVIPYPLLNPLMGLSAMRLRSFFGYSLLGMLPGSAAYVLAGTGLQQFERWDDLLSTRLMFALLVLALLPWVMRWGWRRWRARPRAATAAPLPAPTYAMRSPRPDHRAGACQEKKP